MSNWFYLVFNLLIIGSAALGGWLYDRWRQTVWPKWHKLLSAMAPVSLIFLIWDMLVTNWWWSFNPQYTLPWHFLRLPPGEWLFFITVPIASTFLWINWKQWRPAKKFKQNINLRYALGILLIILSFYSWSSGWIYTAIVSILLVLTVMLSWRWNDWQERRWWQFLLIIFTLTLIFNGFLTGLPVVTYQEAIKSGVLLGPVPIEDFIYGYILLILIIWRYEQSIKN